MPPPQETVSRVNIQWAPGLKGDPQAAAKKADVRKNASVKTVPGYERLEQEGWEVCELPHGLAKKSLEWLNDHPNVLFAEPEGFGVDDPVIEEAGGSAQGVPEFDQWYQKFLGIPAARTVSRGAGVTIAVLDNGITPPHVWNDPRLGEQKLFRLSETNGTLGGSHGQPVMGLVSAAADDAVCTNFKIGGSADVKCSWSDVSVACYYAKDKGLKVINLSYGGGSSMLLVDTLMKMKAAGIAVVVSAGNSSTSTQFPANNQHCYAVSALDEAGNIAGFSCRGKIDICAPGVSLLTSIPGGGWAGFSGTSGSAPLISGLLALILAKNPTWTGVQAMEHLLATATPKLPATDYGRGIPNILKALGIADTATPPPPTTPPPPPPSPPPPSPTPTKDDQGPSKMAQPAITEKSSTGFRATWVAAKDNVGVVLHRLYLNGVAVKDVPMPDVTWLFTGLDAAKSPYVVQIRGVDAATNQGPHSDPLHVSLPVGSSPPPPPPEETWVSVREVVSVTQSPWEPTTAVQTATKTETVKYFERSNLGNVRNERPPFPETSTTSRTVDLPQ